MSLLRRTDTERYAGYVQGAEGVEAASGESAGVHLGPGLQTPGVWVTSAAGPADTRVGAHLVLAHGVDTAWIGQALILVRNTLGIGVSDEVDRAGTLLDVVDHLALSIDSTSILLLTQVDTGSSDTALGRLTVLVDGALHLLALDLGVPLEALGADTDGPVVCDPALRGAGTPGGGQAAGVPALAARTHLLVAAVRVQHTPGLTHAAPAEVTLGTRDVAAALLSARAAHTLLTTGAVLAGGALLGAHSVLASIASVTVGALAAGVGQRKTTGEGVASGGWRTGAECLVTTDRALSTGATLGV